jgi:transcriptional regulator
MLFIVAKKQKAVCMKKLLKAVALAVLIFCNVFLFACEKSVDVDTSVFNGFSYRSITQQELENYLATIEGKPQFLNTLDFKIDMGVASVLQTERDKDSVDMSVVMDFDVIVRGGTPENLRLKADYKMVAKLNAQGCNISTNSVGDMYYQDGFLYQNFTINIPMQESEAVKIKDEMTVDEFRDMFANILPFDLYDKNDENIVDITVAIKNHGASKVMFAQNAQGEVVLKLLEYVVSGSEKHDVYLKYSASGELIAMMQSYISKTTKEETLGDGIKVVTTTKNENIMVISPTNEDFLLPEDYKNFENGTADVDFGGILG